MPKRTKEEAAQTRDALLDSAITVFLRVGVARATLNEIAAEAGVTRGAVYWHFRDKLALFLALEDRARLPLNALLDRMGTEEGGGLEALGVVMAEAFAGLEADPVQRRLLLVLRERCEYTADMAPAVARQRSVEDSFRTRLTAFFTAVAERGALRQPWTPESAALATKCLCSGLVDTWLHAGPGWRLTEQGSSTLKAFMTSLAV